MPVDGTGELVKGKGQLSQLTFQLIAAQAKAQGAEQFSLFPAEDMEGSFHALGPEGAERPFPQLAQAQVQLLGKGGCCAVTAAG